METPQNVLCNFDPSNFGTISLSAWLQHERIEIPGSGGVTLGSRAYTALVREDVPCTQLLNIFTNKVRYALYIHLMACCNVINMNTSEHIIDRILSRPDTFSNYNNFTFSEPSIERIALNIRLMLEAEANKAGESLICQFALLAIKEIGKLCYINRISADSLLDSYN